MPIPAGSWLISHPGRIEWFIEGQAFLRSYKLAPPPPILPYIIKIVSLSQFSCVSPVELTDGRGGGRGVLRPQEILSLYKTFNTLCSDLWFLIAAFPLHLGVGMLLLLASPLLELLFHLGVGMVGGVQAGCSSSSPLKGIVWRDE